MVVCRTNFVSDVFKMSNINPTELKTYRLFV